jgi:hypothetical protein
MERKSLQKSCYPLILFYRLYIAPLLLVVHHFLLNSAIKYHILTFICSEQTAQRWNQRVYLARRKPHGRPLSAVAKVWARAQIFSAAVRPQSLLLLHRHVRAHFRTLAEQFN